jgi:hypothetical protein
MRQHSLCITLHNGAGNQTLMYSAMLGTSHNFIITDIGELWNRGFHTIFQIRFFLWKWQYVVIKEVLLATAPTWRINTIQRCLSNVIVISRSSIIIWYYGTEKLFILYKTASIARNKRMSKNCKYYLNEYVLCYVIIIHHEECTVNENLFLWILRKRKNVSDNFRQRSCISIFSIPWLRSVSISQIFLCLTI